MDKKRVIALGFFDGVHLGHIELMKRAYDISSISNYKSLVPSVTTFDTHPLTVLHEKEVPLINSSEDRAWLIRTICGINDTLILHFDKKTAEMNWDEFLRILSFEFGAEYIIAGEDYKFGKDGIGNSLLLKDKCNELGIGCDIIPEVKVDGVSVSSTIIRDLLIKGDILKANRMLGHPHILTDTVRYGFHLGSKLGTPTINMLFGDGVLIPKNGVYATKIYIESSPCAIGVTNIGARPTVDDSGKITAETHILDFRGNLYGRKVRIEFHDYIRSEKKFDSLEELKNQIQDDCKTARELFVD